MNMMRQIHNWCESIAEKRSVLKLCSVEAMPSGWSVEQDEDLLVVVDQFGLDNLSSNINQRPAFQNVRYMGIFIDFGFFVFVFISSFVTFFCC